jgi:gamma-glutamylaminecyclotransferase
MCVIIIKQKGRALSKETIKTSARINPHGLGVVWLDTFQVSFHYSNEYSVLFTDRPFIAHFRYATIGAIGKENTHPFRCGSNNNEWLMMNGTIYGLGDLQKCDSKVLANNLGNIPRQTWANYLSKYDCRFVTINTYSRSVQIYNKHLWTQRDGVWFSKDNVLEDNLIAVYGTLKKGYTNYNTYLTTSKFIGSGKTKDKYPLIIKGLPYMIDERGKGHNVAVDVFKVSNPVLDKLDKLEGHPTWYKRKQIPVVVKGKTLTCWIYFNICEAVGSQPMHTTYTQSVRPQYFDWSYVKPEPKPKPSQKIEVYEFGKWHEVEVEECDECDFDVQNELPMCSHCYGDVHFDGFSNYHCYACGSWLTQNEIINP